MSSEHFTVDGTLIEARALLKSFEPKMRGKDKQGPPDDPAGIVWQLLRGQTVED
jgi:hypothetical protein